MYFKSQIYLCVRFHKKFPSKSFGKILIPRVSISRANEQSSRLWPRKEVHRAANRHVHHGGPLHRLHRLNCSGAFPRTRKNSDTRYPGVLPVRFERIALIFPTSLIKSPFRISFSSSRFSFSLSFLMPLAFNT